MRRNYLVAVATLLLLLAADSDAVAQGQGKAYGGQQRETVARKSSTTRAEFLENVGRIGYEEGYAGEPKDWHPHTTSSVGKNYYRAGHDRGALKREEEAKEARHQELLGLYGSEANVDQFEMGLVAAAGGGEAQPPGKRDPSAYIAYVEGYHQGKVGVKEPSGESALADEALPLTQLYVEQLNAMKYEAERYYVLLERLNKTFELAAGKTPTVAESVGRSELALKVAMEMDETHMRLHQHAWTASRLNPHLVAAFKASATRLLQDKESNEFPSLQKDLHANADQMATQARQVAAEPVSVPKDFEKLGRFHKASIAVIARTLEVDKIRLTLASGRSDPEVMLVGIREYTTFCKSWHTGHLREWKESRLPRMYGAVGATPPGDTKKRAKDDVDLFLLQGGAGGR